MKVTVRALLEIDDRSTETKVQSFRLQSLLVLIRGHRLNAFSFVFDAQFHADSPHTHLVNQIVDHAPAVDQASVDRAPWLLRAVAVTVFLIPPNFVFAPLGANGFVAMILALFVFGLWITSAAWGLHDPVGFRNPARLALGILWFVTAASYVVMSAGPAGLAGRMSADRWVLTLMAITGIALTTAEFVRGPAAIRSLIRAMTWGATLCAMIAICQFAFGIDPVKWISEALVGMTDNGGNTTFQTRAEFTRVAGTMFSPIELGVVMSLMLPFAVWRGLFDRSRYRWLPWAQCVFIAAAAVCTVSRSMLLSLLVVCLFSIPFLPRTARLWAAVAVPVAVVAVFVTVPGMIATLKGTLTVGSADPSITTRLNNYPRVEAMVSDRPWFGTGPGTYLPENALKILDNQYLKSSVEMGIAGAVAVALFFGLTAFAGLLAARHFRDPEMKALAGAVFGAGSASLVASAAFDSFSFPTFTLISGFIAGLSGVVWLAARGESSTSTEAFPERRPASAPNRELTA
ncbi:O-antigen ligase family protein [Williamsia sp.]|uniref:O-antigen ligase family protein n=1 Tax=Williamsia sp. TaxID=1872085 RepID=UPI002F92785D